MSIAGRITLAYSIISIAQFGSKSCSHREAVGFHSKSMQSWHRCSSRTRYHKHSRNLYTNYIWMTKLGCHEKFIEVIRQFYGDATLKKVCACWDLLYQGWCWWQGDRRLEKMMVAMPTATLTEWYSFWEDFNEDNCIARCNPRFQLQWCLRWVQQ